jgi:cytochrome c peroxidase
MQQTQRAGLSRIPGLLLLVTAAALPACGGDDTAPPATGGLDAETKSKLLALALPARYDLPADATNRYADDPAAAALGQKFFFDPRFSGPLIDEANNGGSQTLGNVGETGKVSCAGCHVPTNGSFVDTRSARGQISLAVGWTRRRTPALLDLGWAPLLGWDGRRPTAFSVAFAVIESPLEFNSSRLFVAQQIARFYRSDYEAIFGPMPALDAFAPLEAATSGCTTFPRDPVNGSCPKPGKDDPEVTRVVVNMGKALQAYMRLLTCGPTRFDAWIRGDGSALNSDEQAGAKLFVGKGRCDTCHSGPYLSDQKFHNVGARGGLLQFTGVDNSNDPGASVGLAGVHQDPLGPSGVYSDGDDGRLDGIPTDMAPLEGAFRTPGLRCLDHRMSYMHSADFRSLSDVIDLFNEGGGKSGFVGVPEIQPLGLTKVEHEQLIAFLLALQGPGPSGELRAAPPLPQ